MDNPSGSVGGDRYRRGMRWDHLFDDLAGQLEHELHAEEADLLHEEERLRLGRLTVRDRFVALLRSGDPLLSTIRLRSRGGAVHRLRLVTVGRDWAAGDLDSAGVGVQGIVPLGGVESLMLSPAQARASLIAGPERSELSARLGIAFLLRDLCRRRVTATIETTAGLWSGTVDRVGRDHLDLAVHDIDRARRDSEIDHVRVIPFDQVVLVRL